MDDDTPAYLKNIFLYADDNTLRAELSDTLASLWQHPEGKALLEKLDTLDTPLSIDYCNGEGINHYDGETLYLYKHTIENSHYYSSDRTTHPFTLERVLAHELFHATDPNVIGNVIDADTFNQRQEWHNAMIMTKYHSDFAQFVHENFGELIKGSPENELAHQLNATITTKMKDEAFVHELVDLSLKPQICYNHYMHHDTDIKAYIDIIESPAIACANSVREGKEPPRDTSYINYDLFSYLMEETQPEIAQQNITEIAQQIKKYGIGEYIEHIKSNGRDYMAETQAIPSTTIHYDLSPELTPEIESSYSLVASGSRKLSQKQVSHSPA